MPTAAGEQPSTRASRNHQESERASSKKRRKQDQRQFPVYRKAYRGDIQTDKNENENAKKREDKLLGEVADCLKMCSRQRLRAVHMSMRQYGNEASGKDVIKSVQNNGVEIQEALLQTMCERFEVRNGVVQLESLYKYLVEAHSKTDRDSVVAERTRNTILPLSDFRPEDVDEDLIWRIQDLLVKSRKYIDIPTLRTVFQVKGNKESTTVDVGVAKQICLDNDMPVYGALLTNLLKRCGAERSEKINYREFLSFLEKGQEGALTICPDLKDLSETEKKQTPIEPNILDELSSRTKSTLMSKLMKKTSIKRQEAKDVKVPEPVPVVLKHKTTSDDTGSQNNENLPKSNAIKAEPGIVTGDDKDVVGSTDTRCAQIIIDIIPPSKEPTLNSAESEPFVTNALAHHHVGESVKSTEGIVNNNETITRDDFKQDTGDDTYEIALNAKERKDVNDDNMDHKVDSEDGVDVKDDNMDHSVDNGEGNDTNSNEMEHILFNGNEHSGSMEMPTNNSDDECNDIVKHAIDANDANGAHETVELTMEVDGGEKDSDLSEQNLHMQWVYGYRGNDCRKNIHVLASSEIVYFMSYVAVIYSKDAHTQRHYTEHTDEIKCVDVDSDGMTVATGQFGSRKDTSIQAHVRIWNAESLQTLIVLGMGEFEKSVACLAFSPGKNMLAAVDNSPGKKLMVWNTVSGEKESEATLHTELICVIGICKKDPDTIIAVGKDHISWWMIDQDQKSLQKIGEPDYQDYPQAKFVICMAFTEGGDVITGDSNGSIYVWYHADHTISSSVKHAHDGPVFTLLCRKRYLLSGGRDGIIHCWNLDEKMETAGFLQLQETDAGIRMLQTLDNDLIVGTTMNSLHLVSLMDGPDDLPLSGAVIDPIPITQGHYDDLQGLVVIRNPTNYNVMTAGQDGIICAFDTNNCKAVFRKYMKGHQYMCIDADDTGHLIALGTKDGCVNLLQHDTIGKWEELFCQKLCKERLTAICISPDMKYIAAGSNNSNTYLLSSISDIWEYHGSLEGHQGAIASLEWVKSEEHETFLLQSISSRLERTYWNPLTMEMVPEVHSATQTELEWIRKLVNDEGVEVQAMDVSPDRNIIAIVDTNGHLRVGRYKIDANTNGQIHLGLNRLEEVCCLYGTPTAVRNLSFSRDGRYFLTVGGRDSSLIQWEINLNV